MIRSVICTHGVLLAALSSSVVKAERLPDFGIPVDMDSDGDSVSDYDDYCPHTPTGSTVWTKAAVEQKHGQANWVGCAGGTDTAQPNYTPAKRPAEATIYEKVAGLYMGGSIPTGDHITGVSLGRCFDVKAPTVPLNKAVFFQGAVILSPDGPLTGNVPAFNMYFISKYSYNALDGVDSISELERMIGGGLDANATLSPAHVADQALLAPYKTASIPGKNSAKINGEYLVVKHTEGNDPTPMYCYFFHKIMNP